MGRGRRVFYDADCGVCTWFAQWLARRDRHRRLELLPNTRHDLMPASMDVALLQQTIVVVDVSSGRSWTRVRALGEIIRALPWGPSVSWICALGYWCLDPLYDLLARHRAAISSWLGLGVCRLDEASSSHEVDDERHQAGQADSSPSRST